MITTSTAFNECVNRSSRTFRARFLKNGQPLDCEVKKVVVRKGACAENFTPGTIFAPYINADVSNLDASIENEEVLFQIGLLLDDGTVEYTNQGYFTVTKPKRSANQTSFDAVGRISSKLNVLPDLPADKTLSKLAAAITAKTGVDIIANGVNFAGVITHDLNGLTCREILEVITSVLGGFATEDGEGRVVISKHSTASKLEYNGDYTTSSPTFNDYNYTLSGIKVIATSEYTDEDGNVVPGNEYADGLPVLTLSNEYMTEELFPAFVQNTVGYSFKPGEIQLALGDPRIEPWDCISFTDIDGSNHVVPCFELTHTFDGGLTTSISAKGESETESSIIVKGQIQKQVERLSADLFTAKEAIIKRIKADEIITDDITAVSGNFTKYLTGVSIIGDLIKANTLKADALILKGTDGIYRKLNIDALGKTTVDSDEKYNNGIDGSVLVAESITADKISVTDLNAFGATIGGFDIDSKSIRSGKTTIDDKKAGVYIGTDGLCIGGENNGSIKFDPKTGTVDIVATNFSIGTSAVVLSTTVTYQVGTSQTIAPTGTWHDTIPAVSDGQYLWTKTVTEYSDGESKTDYSVAKQSGDAITMSITSSNGNVLTSSSDSTVLTAHVYVNGVEQTIASNGVCGTYGTVKWYLGTTLKATSNTLTVKGSEVTDSAAYTVKLE